MTQINVEELELRQIDALIWKGLHGLPVTLFGLRHIDGDWQPHAGYPAGHISPPHYSSDDADAVVLAREMQGRGYVVEISMHPEGGVYCTMVDYPSIGDSFRDSFAEAVARASLKALLEE